MKKSKFNNLSNDLEEVPNSELKRLKGGSLEATLAETSGTGSLKPNDDQLLLYGIDLEDDEEWTLEDLDNQDRHEADILPLSFRFGMMGEGREVVKERKVEKERKVNRVSQD